MEMIDLIQKKKNGGALTNAEIQYFVSGYTNGSIPDYQASALLMAICFCGMSREETADLTQAMMHSGACLDLGDLYERSCDKHSTGGVGDKTTLIVAPIVAAGGGVVAKMSGRGLGHTGGTVDKLESIPGFQTALTEEEFLTIARTHGICVAGQSGDLVPADKKLYALRDVTATVDQLALIASSIMCKKLASGAKNIVLDVKVGSGAFMKDAQQARLLAREMVEIGRAAGRNVAAVLTDMDAPLGNAVGNAIEVWEAVQVLRGGGPEDLRTVSITLAAQLFSMLTGAEIGACKERAEQCIKSGEALRVLCDMVRAQGGDERFLLDASCVKEPAAKKEIYAPQDGWLFHMQTDQIGRACVLLGAGRARKEDAIDHSAGIVFHKKTGDRVCAGACVATLYAANAARVQEAATVLSQALTYSDEAPVRQPLIREVIR